jgi:hypothetical protein
MKIKTSFRTRLRGTSEIAASIGPESASGQEAKGSQRANLVRFTLNSGHCANQRSGQLGAKLQIVDMGATAMAFCNAA